jgi:hypothetical protein
MMPRVTKTESHPSNEAVAPSCDGCFFRQMLLCALPGNTPCPTFRPASQAAKDEQSRRHLAAVA